MGFGGVGVGRGIDNYFQASDNTSSFTGLRSVTRATVGGKGSVRFLL